MQQKHLTSRHKLYMWLAGIIALVLTILGTAVYINRSQASLAQVVSPNGGTYQFGDLTVIVPPGAVSADTKLTATGPEKSGNPAPLQGLGATGVRFDLSLAKNLQPAKPLTVKIPLAGKFLPQGAKPHQALFYTTGQTRTGYQLVPYTVENNVLVAQLPRLSPKWLQYLDSFNLFSLPEPGSASDKQCQQKVSTKSTGEIRLAPDKSWSQAKNSPVHPCLEVNGNHARLTVTNNTNYIWSIRPQNGLKVTSVSDDDEAEAIKHLTNLMFSGVQSRSITGYLSRDSNAVATLTGDDLPATIKFEASPNTFLAESVWISLNFLVSAVVGEKSGRTVELAADLLDVHEVINCLKSVTKIGLSPSNIDDVIDFVIGKCGEIVATTISDKDIIAAGAWRELWNKFFIAVGGINDAIMVTSALTGIMQQWKGLITIKVDSTAPFFSAFSGIWASSCGDLSSKAEIDSDGSGRYIEQFPNWTTGVPEVVTSTFHLIRRGNFVTMVIDKAQGRLKSGQEFPLSPKRNNKTLVIKSPEYSIELDKPGFEQVC